MRREEITVLTTLGMSIFSPFDSFSVLVLYAPSGRYDGLDVKSRKWSTLTGSNLDLVMDGVSMSCPGLVLYACFLASSILNLVSPGTSCRSSVLL